jgi:hypothetical protein
MESYDKDDPDFSLHYINLISHSWEEPVIVVRLNKICLNRTCIKVCIGNHSGIEIPEYGHRDPSH